MTSMTPPTAPTFGSKVARVLRHPLFRIGVLLVIVAAIVIFAREHLNFISEGIVELRRSNKTWIALAGVALIFSMVAQAEVMVVLLRSAGVKVQRLRTNLLGLAANAWSATFPGGPAISAAMVFREQMKWGATPVIASWYMILSGALAGAGMALLAIGAVFFLGLKVSWISIIMAIVALAVIAVGVNWLAHHPLLIERWAMSWLRRINRWRRKPEDLYVDKLAGLSEQLAAVKLPLWDLFKAMCASLMNWILEIVCLLACAYAVGGNPPIAGVVLSFLTAKLVGQAQVTPGGLGTVDMALTSTLVAMATLTIQQAFAAALVFRMLSFIGLTALGWAVYALAKFRAPDDTAPAPLS